ncbi:glycosyltransferase [Pseudoxanthomonas sp. SGD-10]|nr:glycosyltransferase [Pseudoxanthomonas sp. SGD-10]
MCEVTVFMAVYNGSAYLRDAIDSILSQTFKDFELLIINDGSTDNSVDIISSYTDPRIRLLHNEQNRGLLFTRNRGVQEARGEYIAILDCDDIAVTDRLETQYNFLQLHKDIAMCGGHSIYIDENGIPTGYILKQPTHNILANMLFVNPFVNSTLMIRKSVIEEVGGYRDYAPAEDFDLSLRIAQKYEVANIDAVLVKYRIHQHNISGTQTDRMVNAEHEILAQMHEYLGLSKDYEQIAIHHAVYVENYSKYPLPKYQHFLEYLKNIANKKNTFDTHILNKLVYDKWYEIIRSSPSRSVLKPYFFSDLFYWPAVKWKHLRKIFKQSIGIK